MDHIERAVAERYSAGAKQCEQSLCCATSYDSSLLEAIPDEVIERDYGCGDPSRYLSTSETVLDLGSGSGKHCFIAAQIVGPTGRVIGVDINDDMLALARGAAPEVARRLGYANVRFVASHIQDMRGCVPDGSVDVVISNCVLNLVAPDDKRRLFGELYRVLAGDGRAIISDIVADRDIPARLQADPELWSGCISGALREDRFVAAFGDAGFAEVELLERATAPWQVVDGIELRSVTVRAHKAAPTRRAGCCG